ncbi:MAG: class I SAM-dependent methyltransferase [Halioglobus sp.]
MPDETHCPLCIGLELFDYGSDRRRRYLQCLNCKLVFVPAAYHLSADEERAVYDLHENGEDDPGYRRFLSRFAQPLLARLPPAAQGLDFGCGPGPALARMLREAGCRVALYDPFYAPDARVLSRQYDFVAATEVVEHLYRPGHELARLWSLLKPGGWLACMTKLVRNRKAFERWHYRNDPTHVCFFSEATWRWWGGQQGVEPEFIGADVILLRKPL